jgi:inner membrane protein
MEDMSDLFGRAPPGRGPRFGPAFKLALIAGLILVLLVPLILVSQLIAERESRADGVRQEVASLWGEQQLINGPALVVPYTVIKVTMQGDKRVEEVVERRAVFLPEKLAIKGRATSKLLHRSIFDVAVYGGELAFDGHFAAPKMADVAAEVAGVRWRDAVLAIAISDVSGMKAAASASLGADQVAFEPSLGVAISVGFISSCPAPTACFRRPAQRRRSGPSTSVSISSSTDRRS